jgi:hypothetical protein
VLKSISPRDAPLERLQKRRTVGSGQLNHEITYADTAGVWPKRHWKRTACRHRATMRNRNSQLDALELCGRTSVSEGVYARTLPELPGGTFAIS